MSTTNSASSFDSLNTLLVESAPKPAVVKRGRPSKADKLAQVAQAQSAVPLFSSAGQGLQSAERAITPERHTALGKAKVLNPSVNIELFQIYFKPEQKKQLDPNMIPFDNVGHKDPLLEFDVFRRLAASSAVEKADLWGAVSWKFGDSMGFDAKTFKNFISKNPGYDIYFCNPHPNVEAIYENLWIQGEISHPNFLKLSAAFLEAAGLDSKCTGRVVPSSYIASANYFVANKRFWGKYLSFVNQALANAEVNLSPAIKSELGTAVADHKGLHNGANYYPFIVERLLTEFLLINHKEFRAIKLQSPKLEARLSEQHKELRELKDLASKSKNTWLMGCWRNYRNLFLSSVAEPKALAPFVRVLSNKSVEFIDLK